MTEETQNKRPPMRMGFRILLIASLTLNLVVIGLIGGAALGKSKESERPERVADFMGAYTRALPSQDRRAIGEAIRDSHRKSGGNREAARQQFESFLTILRASPFDADALKSAIEGQSTASAERRSVAQKIWLEHVSNMSDAERAGYADDIEEQVKRRSAPRKGPKPQ